jgi:hypothetical protein
VKLYHLTRLELEEDEPEFHEKHQALTRLAEPSFPLVCLYGTPEQTFFDAACSEPVDLRGAMEMRTVERLLRRSVSLSGRRFMKPLLDSTAVPPGWRRSALLRHHRLIVLDRNNAAPLGDRTLRLDDELGVVVTEGEEEP